MICDVWDDRRQERRVIWKRVDADGGEAVMLEGWRQRRGVPRFSPASHGWNEVVQGEGLMLGVGN